MSHVRRCLLGAAAVLALAAPQPASAQDTGDHTCADNETNAEVLCHMGGGSTACYAWVYVRWGHPLLPYSTHMCVTTAPE